MQQVQDYYAVYAHCEQCAGYYVEKYEQPYAREAAVYEPEGEDYDDE